MKGYSMKHRKHFCFFAVLILLAFLAGCNATPNAIPPEENNTVIVDRDDVGFEEVITFHDDGANYTYFREVATDVLYVWRDPGSHYKMAGFSIMMDPQTGGPLTFENWANYLKEKTTASTCVSCGADCTTAFCGACGTPMNQEN